MEPGNIVERKLFEYSKGGSVPDGNQSDAKSPEYACLRLQQTLNPDLFPVLNKFH